MQLSLLWCLEVDNVFDWSLDLSSLSCYVCMSGFWDMGNGERSVELWICVI